MRKHQLNPLQKDENAVLAVLGTLVFFASIGFFSWIYFMIKIIQNYL